MKKQYIEAASRQRNWIIAAVLGLAAISAGAQTPQNPPSPAPPIKTPDSAQDSSQDSSKPPAKKPETHITPEEAKQLFALVDQLIQFSSQETGLPIKSSVKRQLTTRSAVESYLNQKFQEDEGAKRLQRGEIVLKKFGLLEHDFDLKPFLLALLKEQIEAYYDSKTKTVNMLDWVAIDEQKPVLAHELTHALQDQRVNLEKWGDQTPSEVSTNYRDDVDHLAKDEFDTAREAVTEGQATAVMMDNILKPMGKSLIKDPEVVEFIKNQMAGSENSPVLCARSPAPLRIAAVPLSRGSELRAGPVDGQGTERGICRRPRSPAHLHVGDHQSARIREIQGAGSAAAARHSPHRRQDLQGIRYRPGRRARPAHPHRAFWR